MRSIFDDACLFSRFFCLAHMTMKARRALAGTAKKQAGRRVGKGDQMREGKLASVERGRALFLVAAPIRGIYVRDPGAEIGCATGFEASFW